MDTSQIKVDLNPQYVRCDIKGKITQLRFDHEIIMEGATIQRSQTTGHLVIKANIVGVTKKDNKSDKINYCIKKDNKPLIKAPDKNEKVTKPFITYKDTTINGISEVKVLYSI